MTTHLNVGQLRAALDGELDEQAGEHLAACVDCQGRQQRMQSQSAGVVQKLSFLAAASQEPAPSAQSALRKLQARALSQKENPMKKLFASAGVRYAAIAVALLALIVAIPATRALADEVLNLFRVQQVTVVPIDFSGLKQLDGPLGQQVSDLISSSMTMKDAPGELVAATDATDASQKAGFSVRLPQEEDFSLLSVQHQVAFDFTIDRTKAQALLDEAGRTELVLPQDIDGAVVSVTVPASVRADYGKCPDPQEGDSDEGSMGRKYPDCVIFSQIPSPRVDAPANVDVAQLAQIGLEFTGMTSEEAAAFTQSVDWTSTLVVPIPKNAATYEQVDVDGVTGTLIERPSDDAAQYLLIWVKDGILYSIGGLGSNSHRALNLANSLP